MTTTPVSVVTSRNGLEVTVPIAWAFTGNLIGLGLIGMVGVFVIVMVTTEVTGVEPSFLSILQFIFGRVWLWIGMAVAVVLIACDRFSNERFIFGPKRVERQFRSGPVVLNRQRFPLHWISDPVVVKEKGSHYVCWRWKGNTYSRRKLNWSGLAQADAEHIAERLSSWLQSPEKPPDQTADSAIDASPLEWLVSVVSSRFGVAVPLLFALTGMLLLAQIWLLYDEIEGGQATVVPDLQVIPGQLHALHWVIDPATAITGAFARVRLEAEIGFDVDGTSHSLHLAGRKFESIMYFESMYLRASEWFGPDSTRFIVPERLYVRLPTDNDWRSWSELRTVGPKDRDDLPLGAVELLASLDRPWLYMVTQATTDTPELQIAFPPGRADRAMPLAWYEAEQAARANVPLLFLAPVTLVSVLMMLLAFPSVLVQSLDRRRYARLLTLVFILAVPWWAGQAQSLPRLVGVDDLVGELAADLIRLHSTKRDHLWFRAIAPPASERGVVVDWRLEQSGIQELIAELGLTELGHKRQWPDEMTAREEWQLAAKATFAAYDDQQLRRFAIAYTRAQWPSRYRMFHQRVVQPAFCTQRPRLGMGFDYQRFIDSDFRCQIE
jgi:hypothetical protein